MGSGFPRSRELLGAVFRELHGDWRITLCATNTQKLDWPAIRQVMDSRIELMFTETQTKLEKALRQQRPDLIIVCRPHNMELLNNVLDRNPGLCADTPIVYDAEALFAVREIEQKRLKGEAPTASQINELLGAEIDLIKRARVVLTVSNREKRIFEKYCSKPIIVASHSVGPKFQDTSFDRRSGFLFVGSIHTDESPNADSLLWFFEEVWPRIRAKLGNEALLSVAGPNKSALVKERRPAGVELLGKVDDLDPLYAKARVFIAPTRFSAGIPLKVLEAAGFSLPCVITPQLCEQLDWKDGEECLVGTSAESFADQCLRLYGDKRVWTATRTAALKSIEERYSPATFHNAVKHSLDLVLNSSREGGG